LIGIPWLLAFALRADGWFLRSDIIWHKPNPMPESVRDRPTSAHEHVFLLTKRGTYFYDAGAIAEPALVGDCGSKFDSGKTSAKNIRPVGKGERVDDGLRNARNVWTIATQPYSGAHFATMPPDLAERCIKAGTKPGDMVLDPFGGAGTTGLVADRLNRHATLIELNPAYRALAADRITDDAPLFAGVA
jgi:DNA modification methylase